MPIMNGFETLERVKDLYNWHNDRLKAFVERDSSFSVIDTEDKCLLIRPMIIFVSQLDPAQFTGFFAEEEKPDFYLEKPILPSDLKSLLQLIKIL